MCDEMGMWIDKKIPLRQVAVMPVHGFRRAVAHHHRPCLGLSGLFNALTLEGEMAAPRAEVYLMQVGCSPQNPISVSEVHISATTDPRPLFQPIVSVSRM